MIDTVRQLLDEHGQLQSPACILEPDADLYAAGLTPYVAIRLMIVFEEAFGVTFKQSMLRRQSFSSIDMIIACLNELRPIAQRQLKAV